jgi:hypothetical protein
LFSAPFSILWHRRKVYLNGKGYRMLEMPRLYGVNAVAQKNPQFFPQMNSVNSRYILYESPFCPLNDSMSHLLPSVGTNAILMYLK